MLPCHVAYVSTYPTSRSSLERLFRLLDRMDVADRDVILEGAYQAFGMSFEEPGDTQEDQMRNRYVAFEATYRSAVVWCRFEEFLVFGLVSFVLAQGYERSGLQSLGRFIDMHRVDADALRLHLASEESPASEVIREIRETMDRIDSLYRELEQRHQAYSSFCKIVVEPLLQEQ